MRSPPRAVGVPTAWSPVRAGRPPSADVNVRRALTPTALVAAAAAALAGSAPTAAVQEIPYVPANVATPLAAGDFNRDGLADLAAGVPQEDVGGTADAGAVHVLYGGSSGLALVGGQLWHQDVAGVPGKVQKNDRFGWSLVAGDFNGDGYDDLVIGAPHENLSYGADCGPIFGCENTATDVNAGYVTVLYGGAGGLKAAGSKGWSRHSDGVKGESYDRTYFGWALAAGDLDGDGYDDLGIGAPGWGAGSGAVHVFFGGGGGLGVSRDQLWWQGDAGVDDDTERGDWFGAALAVGNLGYSTREQDLAIGAPGESLAGKTRAGAVHVLYGQPGKGPTTTLVPDRLLTHEVAGVAGEPQNFADFGAALAIGDFGRTVQGDLAVGSPGLLAGGGTGSVSVFYGGSYGVVPAESELWHRGSLLWTAEQGIGFGTALAAADFNGSSRADLAIAAPGASILGANRAGTVQVVYGSPLGLRTTGSIAVQPQLLHRRALVSSGPRNDDRFGTALAAGNFGAGAGADLAIGGPGVDAGDTAATADAGEVFLAYGATGGLVKRSPGSWNQNTPDVPDSAESGDRLGGG